MSDGQGGTLAFETGPAKNGFVGARLSEARLLRVRDTQAANSGTGGHGRGPNSCWSACFNDYNACMDRGPENVCVSRMKTCLAICDRISRRPDM